MRRGCIQRGLPAPNGDLFPTVNMGNVRKALEILKSRTGPCAVSTVKSSVRCWNGKREAKAKTGRTSEEKIRDFLDSHDVWTEYVATKM